MLRKIFTLLTIGLLFFASPSFAVMAGHSHVDRLWVFVGEVDLDDECIYSDGNGVSGNFSFACNSWPYIGYHYPDRAGVITRLVSEVLVAGTAGYGCEIVIRQNNAAVGTAQVVATSAAAGTVTATAQSIAFSGGDDIELQVTDGAGALVCDAGTNPRFKVIIYGYYTE